MNTETTMELIRKAPAGGRSAAERMADRHRRPTLAPWTLGNTMVDEAVASLSQVHRETVLPHCIGCWSHAKVAEILETPLDTVRSRLMTAKRRTRVYLDVLSTK